MLVTISDDKWNVYAVHNIKIEKISIIQKSLVYTVGIFWIYGISLV